MSRYMRVATAWLTGCSGCHMATLDLADELERVLHVAEFVFTPVGDVREAVSADVGLVEGAVSTTADERLLRVMREKCRVLVALGSCATSGGVPAMRNGFTTEEMIRHCYAEAQGLDAGGTPEGDELPALRPRVDRISDVVSVELEVPGCAPSPQTIGAALMALSQDEMPTIGAKNLCVECDREHSFLHTPRRQFLADYTYAHADAQELEESSFLIPRNQIEEAVYAPFELDGLDTKTCFLEQGVLCMGPATRQGCKAACPAANYPCRGCFGPTPKMFEQGSRLMDALATILPPEALMHFEDLIGTGYRFSPPRFTCGPDGEDESED